MSDAPFILSLDVATLTGVAEGRAGEVPRFYSLDFSGRDHTHADTFAKALRWIAERLKVGGVDLIAIEAPLRLGAASGQTNADTVLRLYGLYAVFAAAAVVRGIRLKDVNVQDARGSFLGNRTVPRDTAKARAMAMCRAIGWSPNTPDEADAGCVHFFAMSKVASSLTPPISTMLQHRIATQVEQEAIAKAAHRRQRGMEIAAEKQRKAERKAAREQDAESLFRKQRV